MAMLKQIAEKVGNVAGYESPLRRTVRDLPSTLRNAAGILREDFDSRTLPWIDRDQADIDAFLAGFPEAKNLPFDLRDKLSCWREKGYVILENVIPTTWLDQLAKEYDYFIEHHDQFEQSVLVESPVWTKSHSPHQISKDVPREILQGQLVKVNNFYQLSVAAKKIMLHPSVIAFLEAIFQDMPVAMQSLNFNYGSQQGAHVDFPYVISGILSHLAASWTPLEDVHPDSGPLFYYVGSHKLPKYNWGNGLVYCPGESLRTPEEFSEWLEKNCKKRGLKSERLLIKKGDVLIWHAALVHGGSPINDPTRTRKSYVCHYSSKTAYPVARLFPNEKPIEYAFGRAVCYENSKSPALNNFFKEGEKF